LISVKAGQRVTKPSTEHYPQFLISVAIHNTHRSSIFLAAIDIANDATWAAQQGIAK
jgi:hypothetical protein